MESADKPDSSCEEAEAASAGAVSRFFEWVEHDWIEIVAAALLALATIMSAWSAYEASRWHARSTEYYNSADEIAIKSSEFLDIALQEGLLDVTIFSNFFNALTEGRNEAAEIYRTRGFSSRLTAAYDAWLKEKNATGSTPARTVFEMPEYINEHREESRKLANKSKGEQARAKSALSNSNNFILLTVLFASVLFFAGISTKFQSKPLKVVVLAMGLTMFLVTVALFIVLPYH